MVLLSPKLGGERFQELGCPGWAGRGSQPVGDPRRVDPIRHRTQHPLDRLPQPLRRTPPRRQPHPPPGPPPPPPPLPPAPRPRPTPHRRPSPSHPTPHPHPPHDRRRPTRRDHHRPPRQQLGMAHPPGHVHVPGQLTQPQHPRITPAPRGGHPRHPPPRQPPH